MPRTETRLEGMVEELRWIQREDVRLAAIDHGGEGPPLLLLHGLAGHAGEWAATAAWLRPSYRVIALEQRGHGGSTRQPQDCSCPAFVADAAFALEHLAAEPAVVLGQSFGGKVAFLLAASRPELVRGLVVAEADPAPDPEALARVTEWLASWPVPFSDREAAAEFFGGGSLWSAAWAEGLEQREGGLWPRFDPGVMAAVLEDCDRAGAWEDWRRIRCPTLVVRAIHGISPAMAERMARALPYGEVAEVPEASHDLHLENPRGWRAAVEPFLARLAEGHRPLDSRPQL
jgi:pimeloyl-ACP methyl ester carboxylesterase